MKIANLFNREWCLKGNRTTTKWSLASLGLLQLLVEKPMLVADIRKTFRLTQGAASVMVGQLERNKIVTVAEDLTNKSYLVSITSAGKVLLLRIASGLNQSAKNLTKQTNE